MADCLISFGSNVGDGASTFAGVCEAFRTHPPISELRSSQLHATQPIGNPVSQNLYGNAAIRFATALGPAELMDWLLAVERKFGRVRTQRWGPRTADLDLLLYGRESHRLSLAGGNVLTVPHPRMSFRRFVLVPSAEIGADMVHPIVGKTIGGLLKHLDETDNVIAIGKDPLSTRAVVADMDALRPASPSNPETQMHFRYEFRTTISAGEFPSNENRYAIMPIDSHRRWMELRSRVKLLVLLRSDLESPQNSLGREMAREFSGPRLELETDDVRDAAVEISSAMAAMLKSSIA